MDAAERRNEILKTLAESSAPLSATALARRLGVSRQIIVGDVALLRAAGESISSTPRGYMLTDTPGLVFTVACVHERKDAERELNIMVDNGCTVLDVSVDHPIYGQLTAALRLSSRYDVSQFVLNLESGSVSPLSALTGGVHLHRLRCPDEASFLRTKAQLAEAGLLYENSEA